MSGKEHCQIPHCENHSLPRHRQKAVEISSDKKRSKQQPEQRLNAQAQSAPCMNHKLLIGHAPERERQAAHINPGKIVQALRAQQKRGKAYAEISKTYFAPAEYPEQFRPFVFKHGVAPFALDNATHIVGAWDCTCADFNRRRYDT